MPLRPGELLIDESTRGELLYYPWVNGERRYHGLIERDYAKYPAEMFAPPSDMPLIPRSEWSDRIKELEANKAQLSDIRGDIPSLDQAQAGYCADDQTEVLTEKGWVGYPDYNWTDPIATVNPATHAMEFQTPFQRHVYEYDGEMIYSSNRRIDFAVTPDHEMYVRKWDEAKRTLSDRYSFVRADDMGWYCGLLPSPTGWSGTELVSLEVPGDRRYTGDDFLALLGLIVSDGYAGGTDNTRNWVSFASFRDDVRNDVEALARRNGFRECPSRRGVWVRYDAGSLASWIRANCYTSPELRSQRKRIPQIVKVASERQIRHFLRYFDDRSRDGREFYSTSKTLIDDLQELHLRIGKRAAIYKRKAKDVPFMGKTIHSGEAYCLTVSQAGRLSLERKHNIERERYRGNVYCAGVPNHTLITRRNGSVLISSNCWAHSTVHCVMITRARDNMPYVPLSAYAVAATIMSGRDEGGWCGLSAKFLREKGVPSQAIWPQGERTTWRNYDKPETWENAARHRVEEDWVDLTRQVYDQNLTFDQVASCLLCGIPCAVDFNWWGHSVCALDLVEVSKGSFGIRIWNSWSDAWGDRGMSVLQGKKAIPDGAVAIRTTRASAA